MLLSQSSTAQWKDKPKCMYVKEKQGKSVVTHSWMSENNHVSAHTH